MTVRVRGIYATALTALLGDDHEVVQASDPIRERFDDEFPVAPADAAVETTRDRQGVSVAGDPDAVGTVADALRGVARDALAWQSAAPLDAVFRGVVTEALNSGAVVDLGSAAQSGAARASSEGRAAPLDPCERAGGPRADGERSEPRAAEGFLPYANTEDYVDEGDVLRVQVRAVSAPWTGGRPELDTDLRVSGELVELVRGGGGGASAGPAAATGAARMEDVLPVDPPEGWAVRWGDAHEDAGMDALAAALTRAGDRAELLMAAVAGAVGEPGGDLDHADVDDGPDPDEAPARIVAPLATIHVWFGRESRFALDGVRREVTTTMPGHHRVKAGSRAASAAVDFAESLCDPEGEFPFDAVTRQFGPTEGNRIAIGHGKPDGRLLTLGRGEVTDRDPAGTVTVRREMSPGGTYDALGVERRAGDVAVTRFHEGRWWYATVYRGDDGTRRGTYVNVCTPLEIFPETVRYVDLHVDVVRKPDGTVERVDDDELDAAVDAGRASEALAERAREVASTVEDAL
jgi:hypothetical protein